MRLTEHGYGATARKLEDGLYRFKGGEQMWIEGGVLFLPVEVLHPIVVLTCGRMLRRVYDNRGRARFFMRASDVMAEAPSLTADVQAVAVKYGCEL
jgi:hypothetical protein